MNLFEANGGYFEYCEVVLPSGYDPGCSWCLFMAATAVFESFLAMVGGLLKASSLSSML